MKYSFIIFITLLVGSQWVFAQDDDALMIKKIHNQALENGKSYEWLKELCLQNPGRITGSDAYIGATAFTRKKLASIPGVSSYLQECTANYWKRGSKEIAWMTTNGKKKVPLNVLSLGNSIATPVKGLQAEVIEVQSLDELERLGKEKIQGKIVFFNRS